MLSKAKEILYPVGTILRARRTFWVRYQCIKDNCIYTVTGINATPTGFTRTEVTLMSLFSNTRPHASMYISDLSNRNLEEVFEVMGVPSTEKKKLKGDV